MSFIRTAILALTLGTTAIAAPDRGIAQTIALKEDRFNEVLRPAAQISGALVAGIQKQALAPGGISLRAHVPADWAGGDLCIRVLSIDGLYEASNTYSVPSGWSGGIADVEFPSKYLDRLLALPSDGVGVKIVQGPCTQQTGQTTVAFWNGAAGDPLTILVNSFRADAVFVYVGAEGPPVKCDEIRLESRPSFDPRCVSAPPAGAPVVDRECVRYQNRKPAPPTSLRRWLDNG